MNFKQKIYIYADEGTSSESVAHAVHTITQLVGHQYQVTTIKAERVKERTWVQDAALFVMPGGADVPYTKKLNGVGNSIIKAYVEKGGAYLGFCAGAYYGATRLEFDKGGSLEVLGDRELGFFPGVARGPILAPYDYENDSGARAAEVVFEIDNKEHKARMYYNGGPFFKLDNTDTSNVSVLGWFQRPKGGWFQPSNEEEAEKEQLPAIVKVKKGKGSVVLSGVHFEYAAELLDEADKHLKKILPDLHEDDVYQRILLQNVLEQLGITTSVAGKDPQPLAGFFALFDRQFAKRNEMQGRDEHQSVGKEPSMSASHFLIGNSLQ